MRKRHLKRTLSRKRVRKLQVFYKISAVIVIAFVSIATVAILKPQFFHISMVGAQTTQSEVSSVQATDTNVSSETVSSVAPVSSQPIVESSAVSSQSEASSSSSSNQEMFDFVEGQVPKTKEVPESYFDDAVFIGDSRTEGLRLYAGPQNADYLTVKGLNVETAMSKPLINIDGTKVTVIDALKRKTYGKVYVMLGVNELGWSYSELFIKRYGELIDEIHRVQPNAQIYVQSIIPVTQKKSESDDIFNNTNIKKYNDLIIQMTKEKRVHFLNVKEGLEDSKGCLPEDASTDGIHLNAEYCQTWMDYISNHVL